MRWNEFIKWLLENELRLSPLEVESRTGIKQPVITRWKNGITQKPQRNTIKRLEQGLGIKIDDRDPENITYKKVKNYPGEGFKDTVPVFQYPIVSEVFAGEPELLFDTEQFEEYQAFTYHKEGHHCFAVRVNGSSMETTLKDGDIVLCDLDAPITNHCLVAVRLKNGKQYIKRYRDIGQGFIHLKSDNGTYDDIIIPNNEIEVIARVVEGIIKF